jgi:hypothetical protein
MEAQGAVDTVRLGWVNPRRLGIGTGKSHWRTLPKH